MSEENIENITKSDSKFAPTFADHHLLLNITFNRHCSINNIYIPTKNNKYIYSLQTKSMVKKFKHIFYIKLLLISICEANQ